MNPVYAILESPHRWSILAGISGLAACLGAIVMIGYGWPYTLARVWFYAGLAAVVFFLVRAVMEWKSAVEESIYATRAREDRK